MAITYQSSGAISYYSSSPMSIAYPASIAAGDLLILIIGIHPSTTNGGTVTTPLSPPGWTLVKSWIGTNPGSSGTGGYSTTNGAGTGNCGVWAFAYTASGSESGNLSVTVGQVSAGWGQLHRLSCTSGNTWDVAGGAGGDTSSGNVSVTASDTPPDVASGDYLLGAFVTPASVVTFSSPAFSASGATIGSATKIAEASSTTGNDVGGFTARAAVTAGSSSANPVMTATAGGTTTNARGPGLVVRIREVVPTGPSNSITAVGTLVGLAASNSPASYSIAPTAVGNMIVAFTYVFGTSTITSLTGGNCTGWTRAAGPVYLSSVGATIDMWIGTATAAGSATATLTASSAGAIVYMSYQEFSGGDTWSVDGSQAGSTSSAATTSMAFKTLTPSDINRLYVGWGIGGTPSGVTSGYTDQHPSTTYSIIYNPSVSTSQSPVITQSSAAYETVAALIVATGGVVAPTNLFMPFFL